MAITAEEKQKRMETLNSEKEAIKKLNDSSDLFQRIEKDKSLRDTLSIVEENTDDTNDRAASTLPLNSDDKSL